MHARPQDGLSKAAEIFATALGFRILATRNETGTEISRLRGFSHILLCVWSVDQRKSGAYHLPSVSQVASLGGNFFEEVHALSMQHVIPESEIALRKLHVSRLTLSEIQEG